MKRKLGKKLVIHEDTFEAYSCECGNCACSSCSGCSSSCEYNCYGSTEGGIWTGKSETNNLGTSITTSNNVLL